MTPETREHLQHCEAAIQEAKRLLAIHGYPDDLRTVMVIGFITQLVEHHEAMLLLIRADKVGSAFALARSPVEGMYRGMWINFAATDAQVARFERDDNIGLTMTQLAQAIDAAYHAGDFFEDLKRRSWDALNSYAHTGVLQLGRRFREHNVEPAYSDGEIFEITTFRDNLHPGFDRQVPRCPGSRRRVPRGGSSDRDIRTVAAARWMKPTSLGVTS